MDTKALRQKVLDLAIRGKLVPQDPNDEPASVLLERIRQEKKQMVKEGKLKAKDIKNDSVIFKGEDNLHYEKFDDGTIKCIEDEIPFEIPDTWSWCRLNTICPYGTCEKVNPNRIEENAWILELEDIEKDTGKILSFVTKKQRESTSTKHKFVKGQLLYSKLRPYLNKVVIAPESGYCTSEILPLKLYGTIHPGYIQIFLMSNTFLAYVDMISYGVKMPRLGTDEGKQALIALPPLTEQQRIYCKVQSINCYINKIVLETESLSKSIELVKSKILDLAIRGKLVPQNPDDEPASVLLERIRAEKEELIKQGKIKRDKNESVIFKGEDNSYYEKFINGSIKEVENDDLFDIPNTWNWCMIRDVAQVKGGKRLPKGTTFSASPTVHGYIRVVDMKDNSIVQDNIKYIDDDVYDIIKNYTISSKDLYITIAGSIGVVGEIPEINDGMNLTENAAKITNICINKSYLFLVLQSNFAQKQFRYKTFQVAMPKLALERILTTYIPLPPLDEQERILQLTNQIFGIIDNVEKSLE